MQLNFWYNQDHILDKKIYQIFDSPTLNYSGLWFSIILIFLNRFFHVQAVLL